MAPRMTSHTLLLKHADLLCTMADTSAEQPAGTEIRDAGLFARDGVIEQVGSPLELYHTPRNKFVAGFIGSPKMNFIEGETAAQHSAHTIGIRPEHLTASATEGLWKGTVSVSEHLGSDTFLHVHDTGHAESMTVRVGGEFPVRHGDTVYLTPEADKIHRFDEKGLRIA